MCKICKGYGFIQVYRTRVMRVYCDCKIGDDRIKKAKDILRELGFDPESKDYEFEWLRYSDFKG